MERDTEFERRRLERKRLRVKYGDLFDKISAMLFECDPMDINFETNTDEYEPEVGTIIPRLPNCKSVADVRRVVHEEFVRWFSAVDTGPEDRYQEIAERIWALWKSS